MKRLVLALVLFGSSTAFAGPTVDWGKGLVTTGGVGLADRQAPNPAVARGTAKRKADEAAKKSLGAYVGSLPLAAGGTLADKLADATIKARVDRAIAGAISVSAEPETDGAWTVTLAVPIEALRQAITGPRVVATSDEGPAVVIVEGVSAKPAIGYTVGGFAGATVWLDAVPAWAKDAPRVKAKRARSGAIDASVKASPSTLFVILTK